MSEAVIEFHQSGDQKWIYTTAKTVAMFLRIAALALGELLQRGVFTGELREWLALIVKVSQALGASEPESVNVTEVGNDGAGLKAGIRSGSGLAADKLVLRMSITE